jgi:hypothetical protein
VIDRVISGGQTEARRSTEQREESPRLREASARIVRRSRAERVRAKALVARATYLIEPIDGDSPLPLTVSSRSDQTVETLDRATDLIAEDS